MTYWLAVVGSRRRRDREAVRARIRRRVAELRRDHAAVGIVTGGATGPDTWAEELAREAQWPLHVIRPDLEGLAKGAPRWAFTRRYHARNRMVAEAAHEMLAFVAPSRTGGTEHAVAEAKRLHKPVLIAPPLGPGIACPQCGGTAWRVPKTWNVQGARRRRRTCQECGRVIYTDELPVREAARARRTQTP